MTPDLPALVRRACLTECSARKPGNVYPGADFPNLTHAHFVAAADVAAATLPRAGELGVGVVVLNCVRATVRECRTNVNLGTALLLAPLCAVPPDVPLAGRGLRRVLRNTTVEDAAAVFEAIRLANPGGLGGADAQDVRGEPTVPLESVMRLAAGRDRVAAQFGTGFADVLAAAPTASDWDPAEWETETLFLFLGLLARFTDSHIARRCGVPAAVAVKRRAADLWDAEDGGRVLNPGKLAALDRHLRGGTPRRNPGTTADLTCAALFVAARDHGVELPDRQTTAAHARRLLRKARRP